MGTPAGMEYSGREINDPAEATTEDEYIDKLAEAGLIVEDRTERRSPMTRVTMTHRLTPVAKDTIHAAGMTIAAYVRSQFPDGVWRGDTCGCSDDRCTDGYHHDDYEECGCLPVLLAEAAKALHGEAKPSLARYTR